MKCDPSGLVVEQQMGVDLPSACVCVCVWARARVFMRVCVCVCVYVRAQCSVHGNACHYTPAQEARESNYVFTVHEKRRFRQQCVHFVSSGILRIPADKRLSTAHVLTVSFTYPNVCVPPAPLHQQPSAIPFPHSVSRFAFFPRPNHQPGQLVCKSAGLAIVIETLRIPIPAGAADFFFFSPELTLCADSYPV